MNEKKLLFSAKLMA